MTERESRDSLSDPLLEGDSQKRANVLFARVNRGEDEELDADDLKEFALKQRFKALDMNLDQIIVDSIKMDRVDPNLSVSDRYKNAFAHVKDALDKRFTKNIGDPWKRRLHGLFYNPWVQFTFIALCFILCLFIFFERPSFRATTWDFQKAETILYGFEVAITLLLFGYVVMLIMLHGKRFFRSPTRVLTALIILAMIVDSILGVSGLVIIRFSRPMRPILFVLMVRALRRAMKGIAKTVWALRHMLILLMIMCTFFSIFGVLFLSQRFVDKKHPHISFNNFGYAFLQLFLAITFEDYPEVIYPATDKTPYTFLYFLVIYFVIFTLFSVIFAILFEVYKEIRLEIAIHEKTIQRKSMAKAFGYIDTKNQGWITYDQLLPILKYVAPKEHVDDLRELCTLIDKDGNQQISLSEFFLLLDITTAKPKKKEQKKEEDTLGRRIVKSPIFIWTINVIIILNMCLFIGLTIHAWTKDQAKIWWRVINAVTIVMVIEMILKNIFIGPRKFWRSMWHVFEAFCVVFAGISQIVIIFQDKEDVGYFFLGFASLTVLRMVTVFKTTKSMASTLTMVFPVTFSMLVCCLAGMYFFAVIGMEAFYKVDAPHVSFNSFADAMFVVYVLLVGHNWLPVLWAYMDWDVSSAAYFCALTAIFNILFLALLVALIIEMYVIVMELKKHRKESKKKNKKEQQKHLKNIVNAQMDRGDSVMEGSEIAFNDNYIEMEKK